MRGRPRKVSKMPVVKSAAGRKGAGTSAVTFTITLKRNSIDAGDIAEAFVALKPLIDLAETGNFGSVEVGVDTHGVNLFEEKSGRFPEAETASDDLPKKRGPKPGKSKGKKRGPKPGSRRGLNLEAAPAVTQTEPKKRGPKPGKKRGPKPGVARGLTAKSAVEKVAPKTKGKKRGPKAGFRRGYNG